MATQYALWKIKKIANEKGMSLVDLAKACDISVQSIHMMVRTNRARKDSIEKIAKALGIEIKALEADKKDNEEETLNEEFAAYKATYLSDEQSESKTKMMSPSERIRILERTANARERERDEEQERANKLEETIKSLKEEIEQLKSQIKDKDTIIKLLSKQISSFESF